MCRTNVRTSTGVGSSPKTGTTTGAHGPAAAARRRPRAPARPRSVAPAALLYVSDADGSTAAGLDLVSAQDEIGRLTASFNELTAHRDRTERQRKAMVSDIAHELRTPLSTIRSVLEATQDGILPAEEETTASLLEETLLLQHIIDDLQDLAAADAGTLRLHPEPVRLAEVLEQVAAAHGAGTDTAGVALRVAAADGIEIPADPLRLRQIVGNLVSNAVRHTPAAGSVTLRARAEGGSAVVEVTDTGTGIAAEDLPLVFDRFRRAERSRSRGTGGSGLGLSGTDRRDGSRLVRATAVHPVGTTTRCQAQGSASASLR
jgi:two-component system sensor histidine kinase BaeS